MILIKPIATNKTPEGWAMDKRIEIKVQKKINN